MMNYKTLQEIYKYLIKNSKAIIEYGIQIYKDILDEDPDLTIAFFKIKSSLGTIILHNDRILQYLDKDLAEEIRTLNNTMLKASKLEELLRKLDNVLRIEIFRRVENIAYDGTILSEYIHVQYFL